MSAAETYRRARSDPQDEVDTFNARCPVGTPVIVRRDTGEMQHTKTRSKAEVLGGHSAVVWLEGITGCYLLERVTPCR